MNNIQFDIKTLETLFTVLQCQIEAELVRAGYEVSHLLKQDTTMQTMHREADHLRQRGIEAQQEMQRQTDHLFEQGRVIQQEMQRQVDSLFQQGRDLQRNIQQQAEQLIQRGTEVQHDLQNRIQMLELPNLQLPQLEMPPMSQPAPTQEPIPSSLSRDVAALLDKVDAIAKQVEQRNQLVAELESRLSNLEEFTSNAAAAAEMTIDASTREVLSSDLPAANQSALVELSNRVAAIERSLGSIDLIAAEVGDRSDTMTALMNRIAYLEKLLQRASIIPRVVDRQGEAITKLETRIARLESPDATNLASDYMPDYVVEVISDEG